MAVLATYLNADCLAVYYYCRSILVAEPFSSSLDNLHLLFEKNKKDLELLAKESKSSVFSGVFASDASGPASLSDRENAKRVVALNVKNFLSRFIGLQSCLFSWTRQCQTYRWSKKQHSSHSNATRTSASATSSSTESSSSLPMDINEDDFMETMHTMLNEWDQILTASVVGEQLLVRILVIAIFGVHFSSAATIRSSSSLSHDDSQPQSTNNAAAAAQSPAPAQGQDENAGQDDSGANSSLSWQFFVNTDPISVMKIATQTHPHSQSESLSIVLLFGIVTRYEIVLLLFVVIFVQIVNDVDDVLLLICMLVLHHVFDVLSMKMKETRSLCSNCCRFCLFLPNGQHFIRRI